MSASYTSLTRALLLGQIDFSAGVFKALLHGSAPTEANLDAWETRADVANEVAAAGGYPSGGFTVSASVSGKDSGNNRTAVTFSATNPVMAISTVTAVGASIYRSTGNAATDLLVCYVAFSGGAASSTNGPFNLVFDTPLYLGRKAGA